MAVDKRPEKKTKAKLLPSLYPHKLEDVLTEVLKVQPPGKNGDKKTTKDR